MATNQPEMVFTVYNELVRVPLPLNWNIESQEESQDENEECIGAPIDIVTDDCPSDGPTDDQTDQTNQTDQTSRSRTCLSGAMTSILNIFK